MCKLFSMTWRNNHLYFKKYIIKNKIIVSFVNGTEPFIKKDVIFCAFCVIKECHPSGSARNTLSRKQQCQKGFAHGRVAK